MNLIRSVEVYVKSEPEPEHTQEHGLVLYPEPILPHEPEPEPGPTSKPEPTHEYDLALYPKSTLSHKPKTEPEPEPEPRLSREYKLLLDSLDPFTNYSVQVQ